MPEAGGAGEDGAVGGAVGYGLGGDAFSEGGRRLARLVEVVADGDGGGEGGAVWGVDGCVKDGGARVRRWFLVFGGCFLGEKRGGWRGWL